MAKTSDHIKPCNIGQSEAHNQRTQEYLSHINRDKLYIRKDLIANNESWISPAIQDMTLQQYYDDIAKMVKEKTGRSMQTKEKKRIDKKTGKTKVINGSSPIKESVVVCDERTTLADIMRYCEECKRRWGITAIQIYLHKDEGHYEVKDGVETWKPNYHAHIIWDWMNHDTGKSCKLGREDMSAMQDIVAECLDMERGTSKLVTNSEHLERNDFILAKQQREMEKAQDEKAKAQQELAIIDKQKQEREAESANLDNTIKEKREQLDKEKGSYLLDKTAGLFGFGSQAEKDKRLKELEAAIPKIQEQLKASFKAQVDAATEKRIKPLTDENEALKSSNKALKNQLNLAQVYNETAESDKARLKREIDRKNQLLLGIGEMLYKTSELIRKAVDALISFTQRVFTSKYGINTYADNPRMDETEAIEKAIRHHSKGQDPHVVGEWLALTASKIGKLPEQEAERAERTAFQIAHHLDYDRQEGYGMKR